MKKLIKEGNYKCDGQNKKVNTINKLINKINIINNYI